MISTAGAGLIAQIIPVLLLIVAVEARALGTVTKGTRLGASRWLRWRMMLTIIAVSLTISAEFFCIEAVSSDHPLLGVPAVTVLVGVFAIGIACYFTVLSLTIMTFVGQETWLNSEQAKERRRVIRDRAIRVRKLHTRERRSVGRRRSSS